MKKVFYKRTNVDNFQINDLVLKWDVRIKNKAKHSKFENIWKGPFKVAAYHGNNAFLLQEPNVEYISGGPVNGRFLKHYFT
jgi:hypothetical protein